MEREGQLLVDYHTAKTQDEKTSYVTYRHYLQDAVFLAGIESEDAALLQQLQQALLHPVFPLYLGRRCCGGWDQVLPVINTFSRPLFTIPGTGRAP